jgi:hypothetical protein
MSMTLIGLPLGSTNVSTKKVPVGGGPNWMGVVAGMAMICLLEADAVLP